MQHSGISAARPALVILLLIVLAGCGGGTADINVATNVSRETIISGSVGDGPIVGGKVLIL
jgi:hypothetical protein